MTYLTRPVFEFPVNWQDSPSTKHEYDVREMALGFGAPTLGQLDSYTDRVLEFTVDLTTHDDIVAFEDFVDSVRGSTQGFWIRHNARGFRISAGVSSTQLDAYNQTLVDTLADHPSQHFLFTKPDGSTVAAQCTGASTIGDLERLTFSPSLGSTPTSAWNAERLLYVRFASDTEKATNITEGYQKRTIQVFELSNEYAAAELGEAPVFLYRFYVVLPDGTESSWRYTSASGDIVSNGDTFTAADLSHGSLLRSMRAENEDLTVEAAWFADSPWAGHIPFPGILPLWLELLSATVDDPDTTTQEFVGRLGDSPDVVGKKVTMRFASWMDSLEASLPRPLVGPRCPYKFGDAATCKVDTAALEKTATINAQVGTRMSVEDASLVGVAAGYFAGGWLVSGTGTATQVRSILSSTADSAGVVTIRLNMRLKDVDDGDTVTLTPGCDKSVDACDVKWSNFPNFGGKPYVPRTNLTLKAVEIDSAGGGKK